jgi:hypothetical protein
MAPIHIAIFVLLFALAGAAKDVTAFTCMTQEEARITNERYQNEDVVWCRPKGLLYGNFAGASPPQQANLYPDKSATYFVANIILPPGSSLILNGQYPHARYVSFTVANQLGDGQLGNGYFLRGDQIRPDEGSKNPFLPENDRNVSPRNFTIYVVQGNPPKIPFPNTLYTGITERVHLSIRTYLVDDGYDGTGNVRLHESGNGLPVVSLLLPGGRIISGPELVRELRALKEGDPNGYTQWHWLWKVKHSGDETNAPCLEVPFAQVFWNTDYSVSGAFVATDPERRVREHPPTNDGGFASNPDTRYMVIIYSFDYGDVLVVRGKMPTHPVTRRGESTWPESSQVQYFSISTAAAPPSGQGWTTACDEQFPTNSKDEFTVAVSWPWNRPANATLRNGVVWLSPGDGEGHYIGARNWVGVLYIRYQNPNPSWVHSPANIPMPTILQPIPQDPIVMGPYYPKAEYVSKDNFEA